jgi:ParB family transcriptional regulator, chromosome partitioning protein
MTDEQSKKRLGRGLAALIGDMDQPVQPAEPAQKTKGAGAAPGGVDRYVPIELIGPNPANPRRHFSDDELIELADSIRRHGVVQPVLVRPSTREGVDYELIAGERRWRAAQKAGLTQLPVVIREVNDRTALQLAIVENVQRSDLNPIEEAMGYQQLIDEHGYSQADLAEIIGKSRSHVANTLRLLRLPEKVHTMIADGSLSAGHARTLVNALDPISLARRIIDEGLSVREAERLSGAPATRESGKAAPHGKAAPIKDADTLALEKLLSDVTGLAVSIAHGDKGGELRVKYSTLEQLDELCRRLQR